MDLARLANLLGALTLELARAQMEAARAASGLGASHAAAVVTLGAMPGVTIARLARVLGLTHSVAVRLADGLVAAGLIERAAGADRREVALRLTDAGALARAKILGAREAALAGALVPLGTAEADALEGAVATILAALTRGRAHADHLCRLCDEDVCPLETCPVERAAVAASA